MMTLDEAIKHCEEKARALRKEAHSYNKNIKYRFEDPFKTVDDAISDCLKCAEEHEQLAEWLKELKALKLKEKPFEINVFLENADESTLFDIKKELARILTDRAEREAYAEARREAMKLDDNEDTLKWKGTH